MFAATRAGVLTRKVTGGQVEFSDGQTTSWVVPVGVTSICVVCVSKGNPGTGRTYVSRGATYLCSTRAADAAFDVRNLGGSPGAGTVSGGVSYGRGGGGAGGYSGAGGNGGTEGQGGFAGSGGGGGGGGGNSTSTGGNGGGGVGLKGQGVSGPAGAATDVGRGGSGGTDGSPGFSDPVVTPPAAAGGTYGGGATAGEGGTLAYKNAIAVTPGETLTVFIPTRSGVEGMGGIRIIWGAGRSYPFAAGDV